MHSFPGVESVTRTSYGLSTIRTLRTRGDDFIITSIGRKGDYAPGGSVVVDLLQVLEGATYAAFIAGAIFAVIELRSINKDRETDFLMRLNDFWSSRDFEETRVKVKDLPETDDPRQIEDTVGRVALFSYVDYFDGIAGMAENKSLKLDFVINLAEWFGMWEKLEPWVLNERQKGYKHFAGSFEWLVEEDQKWFIRNLPRAELDS